LWDGRADSLWSQPLGALENPIEMGTTRLAIAHRLADVPSYRASYESIFGALPALDDTDRFPPTGRPGDASWEAMTAADRDAINRVAANVGKALEAYMRRITSGPAPLDRYLDGERDALSLEARRGLTRFVESGCAGCHFGAMLTDDEFHSGREGGDRGRAHGNEELLASPFNSAGDYYDHDAGEALALPLGPVANDEHAFRTPSLRKVTLTAPHEHDRSRSLEQILSARGLFYMEGDDRVMAAFLGSLEGEPPPASGRARPEACVFLAKVPGGLLRSRRRSQHACRARRPFARPLATSSRHAVRPWTTRSGWSVSACSTRRRPDVCSRVTAR
jgi:cytochrome c peroxidase